MNPSPSSDQQADQPVRVLVVDDSPTMRAVIGSCLRAAGDIQVVGEAGDPYEAREAIRRLSPDVITLDVEMPRMDGLDFLGRLMRLRPTPVIMISTLTFEAAEAAIRALELGAFECIGKPIGGDLIKAFADLPDLVRAAAKSKLRQAPEARKPVAVQEIPSYRPNDNIVAIESSTGGVEALIQLISTFPANCPPTVITQHIPASFSWRFAMRLDQNSAASVSEAVDGAPLLPGRVYLAPGGEYHLEVEKGPTPVCRLRAGDLHSGHRPSVDVLFQSVAKLGANTVGVILTGMGKDGAEGLGAIRAAGGHTIGQDEATSIVYGMPRVAFETGAVETQLPLPAIAPEILRLCAASGGIQRAG
ncbi:MAG TPA: chemotaxis response regulator protein-glutamate methylesterase [Hyphomonas sp.]|nr:chemotaxis response regulator protein-glutamate methylesterase [Hyphomonas sp.]HPE46847.1 chemotaxis response regulator protein-glutamate methylesterase [Hyphomonas sp.]